ncbi:MAG: hypothetical protein IJZ24_05705 [Clostridia bacterium]|nr:hypothetical protein [Clostridia bacterium]
MRRFLPRDRSARFAKTASFGWMLMKGSQKKRYAYTATARNAAFFYPL